MFPTFHGTVQSDPMRIPAPARMSRDRDDAFAAALERAEAPHDPVPQEPPPQEPDVDDELTAEPPPATEAAERTPAKATTADDATTAEEARAALQQDARAATGAVTETQRRGEPGRRIDAGKGADSLRTPPTNAQAGEPLLAGLLALSARDAQQRTPAPVAMAPTVPAAAPTSGEALLRGVEAAGPRADRPTAAAVKPGYRTSQAATAQLLDQARDSIFKQILMRITGDGGEMRMRLEPPDLGELDLRFVVEKGNRLSLAIAVERADMADLIQRHVAELAEALAGVGLQLARADVHARGTGPDAGSRREAGSPDTDEGAEDGDRHHLVPSRSGGYIRADGLDFWV